jgi:hypothetical protein
MNRIAIALLAVVSGWGESAAPLSPAPAQAPKQESPEAKTGPIREDAMESAKRLVVMIDASINGDTRPGAGIIFGLANDRVYIATANHLVRRGASQASPIQVEFKWSPGEPFAAELLTYYDTALDLAVIVVPSLAKTRADRANLPLDRLGNPAAMVAGVRGDPVWSIGNPDGAAYETSAGQVSQRAAVVLKYQVQGLVPGGYSGGPLVDRNGLLVGMVRQDQPPNAEATRMDLIVEQLNAWGYQVGLRSPGSSASVDGDDRSRSGSAAADSFAAVLQRYVREAPSGFAALGAANQIGGWTPKLMLPGAVRCRGRGPGGSATIQCVVAHEKSEVDADDTFGDVVKAVQAALPGWTNAQMNMAVWSFSNGKTDKDSTVALTVQYARSGTEYDVELTVFRMRDQ